MRQERGAYVLSDDPADLDVDAIHRFLRDEAYWSRGIPREVLDRAIANSVVLGITARGALAAFARVATDRATFGWLCDVFVVPEHRGRGLSKWLVEAALAHPDLQGLRNLMLGTRDAHGLYERYGFEHVDPGRFLRIHRPYRPD